MELNDMIMVSVDDHVCEPPDMWEKHLPAKWKDQAPRLVNTNGADIWFYDGKVMPNVGVNAVAGRVPEEYGMEPTALDQMRPGAYNVDARVDDMNASGVLGSICFASAPGFVGQLWNTTKDKDLALAIVRAYNDWHIDEWCGKHPGRFIPLSLPVMWDTQLGADEIRRCAKKGCYAVSLPDNPIALGYKSFHDSSWEPIWQVCNEENITICLHIGSGTQVNLQDMNGPAEILISSLPITLHNVATELVFSEFIRKYDNLKFALTEGGAGWVPYFMERADYTYEHHHRWTKLDLGKGRLPSDIFREHILACFIDDKVGIHNRDFIGIDNMAWEADYPHSDTTWPHTAEKFWKSIEGQGVTDEEIDKLTYQNAMKWFNYDPFKHLPREQCTVGALREKGKHVDTALVSHGRGLAPSDYAKGYATIEDIVKQMGQALTTVAIRK